MAGMSEERLKDYNDEEVVEFNDPIACTEVVKLWVSTAGLGSEILSTFPSMQTSEHVILGDKVVTTFSPADKAVEAASSGLLVSNAATFE